MQGWISVGMSVDELGTYATISYWSGKPAHTAVKLWDHRIEVSTATECPDDEVAQWSSMMARTVSRYFEDRVIEQIRASVSKTNVSEE